MIIEGWHGIFNRKGELLAVEEGADMATAAALNLELDPARPTNKIGPVVILTEPEPGADIVGIIERTVERIRAERSISKKAGPFVPKTATEL